ncbi:class I SAM-dependent methyltransferase [Nocardia takedensis]
MPTLPPDQAPSSPAQTAETRRVAQSFGVDAQRYDRARPRYPDALVARTLAGAPGGEVLDVGCGTGIAARQFRAAGAEVLGVEPDARMAEFARAHGIPVEVATFEEWDPRGRGFDAVLAAQSWHWVDPVTGAAKAAEVLRPNGRLVIFGHAYEPPAEVAEPFAAALARVAPESPFAGQPARRPVELYETAYVRTLDQLRATERFVDHDRWRFEWQRSYTREEWLELLPTTGGLTSLHPDQIAEILSATGAAIDALGGTFTMDYTTLAATAVRAP